ncbi:MAG TPA: response regulator [Candidatus Limnocylindrales bacterium]
MTVTQLARVPAAPRTAPTILIVDDDEYVHGALAATLRGLRARLLKARTAAEARQLALLHRPDLAIVDVGLPDRDGYELAAELRDEPALAAMRVLILTGHAPDQAAADAARAHGLVAKPFRLHPFLELVRTQLATR